MDTLSFVAALVQSLAWPLATLGIAILFRKQLVDLFRTMKKGKVGPAEFEFERDVRAIESAATSLPVATPEPKAALEAASNPRGAILGAWVELQQKATYFAIKNELIKPSTRPNPHGAVRAIINSDLLSAMSRGILKELYELRNVAAHSPDFQPDADAVLAYVESPRVL